jgi:hypothetical protein
MIMCSRDRDAGESACCRCITLVSKNVLQCRLYGKRIISFIIIGNGKSGRDVGVKINVNHCGVEAQSRWQQRFTE